MIEVWTYLGGLSSRPPLLDKNSLKKERPKLNVYSKAVFFENESRKHEFKTFESKGIYRTDSVHTAHNFRILIWIFSNLLIHLLGKLFIYGHNSLSLYLPNKISPIYKMEMNCKFVYLKATSSRERGISRQQLGKFRKKEKWISMMNKWV